MLVSLSYVSEKQFYARVRITLLSAFSFNCRFSGYLLYKAIYWHLCWHSKTGMDHNFEHALFQQYGLFYGYISIGTQ